MPPLGFGEYKRNTSEEDPMIRRARQSEARAVSSAQYIMRAMQGSMNPLRYAWRVSNRKGVDTPKAYYPSDTIEENQIVAAWLHDDGDVYTLRWQVVERRDGEWSPVDEAGMQTRGVTIPRDSGSGVLDAEGTFAGLEPAERLRFANDLEGTLSLVHAATQAALGIYIPGEYKRNPLASI